MSRPRMSRVLAVGITTVGTAAVVAVPSPASASSMYFSKSSGTLASTSWLEIGELPAATGALGNAHFGDLTVEDLGRGRARAFGKVVDVQCDEGVTPYLPGGHGGEPGEQEGCEHVGLRFMEGGSALSFTIDRKLTRATLTGTLSVSSGHGEGPIGAPPVSIVWNGVGGSYSSTERGTFTDETGSFTYRYSFTGRDAQIAAGSRIGPMVFDDEAGESSYAQLGTYRSAERSRS